MAARVRANDAAVILCAQKLTSWQLREDLTDLKRDECKSAYGVHSLPIVGCANGPTKGASSYTRQAQLDGQPTTKHREDACQTEQTEGVCSNRVSDAVPTTPR